MLWTAHGIGHYWFGCARRRPLSPVAPLDRAMVIHIFGHNAGCVMVIGNAGLQMHMRHMPQTNRPQDTKNNTVHHNNSVCGQCDITSAHTLKDPQMRALFF